PPASSARSVVAMAVAVAASLAVVLGPVGPATAATAGAVGNVRGAVTEGSTGRPVAGAIVRLPADGPRATSGGDGAFGLTGIRTVSPYRRLTVVVTAPGSARWTITGVPLYPNDTLILSVALGPKAFVDHVLTPRERAEATRASRTDVPTTGTCSSWNYQQ